MCPVVHEAGELVLVEVEDSASSVLNAAHRAHGVTDRRGPETAENGVNLGHRDATLGVGLHLDSDHSVLTRDETPGVDGTFVVAGDESEGCAESLLCVTSLLLDEGTCGFDEEGEHVVVDLLKVLHDVHSTSLDHVLGLGNTDTLELDASLMLNLLYKHFGLACVESDAGSFGTSSSSTATSVDVGLSLLGGLDLNDQVDVRDVEAS